MKSKCTKCNNEYELDDSYIGQEVECECGNKWLIERTASIKLSSNNKPSKTRKVKCPKCKHKFEESIKEKKSVCPRCNNVFTYVSPLQTGCGCIIVVIVLIWLFGWGMNSCFTNLDKIPVDKIADTLSVKPSIHTIGESLPQAGYYAEQFVKQELKSPSTAKFQKFPEHNDGVMHLGNDEYEVTSYVDSQNSFGAMIRTRFTVRLRYIDATKKWELIQLNFHE